MKNTYKVSDTTQNHPRSFVENGKDGTIKAFDSLKRSKSFDKEQSETERSSSNSIDDENKKKENLEKKQISFWQIYRYAEPLDYFLLILGMLLGIIQGIFQSIQAIIFKNLSNTLIEGQATWGTPYFNMHHFYDKAMNAIYMYVSYGAAILVLATISMSCWHTVCERQIHRIRKHYFAAVLRQNMGWFDKHESGELTTRMFDGIDRIKDGIGDKMGIMFTYGAACISGIVVAFTCSWRMTLVMLSFMPVLAGLMAFLVRFVSISVRKEMRAYEKAGAIAEEVIMGIRTVIALNGQKKEIDRYESNLSKASKFGIRKALFIALGTAWLFCLIFVAMGVAFWYGTTLYNKGLITPGAVFATFWAVMGGTISLGMAAPQIGALVGARNAASSIFEVIDREPEINSQSSEGSSIENPQGEIEFKNVQFCYPTRPEEEVLKGVSFKVKAEQSVALVGSSGCGKSTLLGLLLRYYDQQNGEITIDGVPVNSLNIGWLRRMVGVVSQEPVLFAATIEENLRLGNEEMTAEDMERVCRMANAHNFIKDLPQGYKTRIGEGGVQLSGGQKQRIAIARALARNPKILLLDEATSALDTESEKIVQHALDRASAGRTTLTIAHRLSTIRNADRIIVLDHGQIVETGTHEELMALGGTYMQLVLAQDIEKATIEPEEYIDAVNNENEELTNFVVSKSMIPSISRYHSRSSLDQMSDRVSTAMSRTSSLHQEIEDRKHEIKDTKAKTVNLLDILRFARPEWLLIFFAFFCAILRGFAFPIFSIIYGAMFRSLAKPTAEMRLEGARKNAIYFTILGVGSGFANFLAGFLFGVAGESLTKRLRTALFANIVKQDGEYFDSLEHASGKLITRLATDAPNIRAAIDQRLADVVQALSSILAGIGVAFYYGPKMAPIGILTAGILMLAQTLVAQYLKKRSEKDEFLTQEPFRLATEAIEQHKTVQYLTREQYFNNEFKQQMSKPHYKALERGIVQAFAFALHSCFIFFNFASAYRYGLWLIETHNATPYIVFQVIEALNVASMSLLAFGTYFPEYVRARLSASLIFKLLNEKPKIDSLSEGGKKPVLEGNIKLDDIRFAYPVNRRRLILRGLNINVFKGKTVALVGPSGCGKSTVIQLLERLYDPLDGKVMYDNIDAREQNLFNLRNQIALVSQEPTLYNYSIRENIAYGLTDVSQKQIEEAAKLANAHNFIMEMKDGYDTIVGEKGGQLSGGQKQRIAIARAMIRNPTILLLDEATSALDSESEKIVQEALDRARSGRTCIVIAHRLSTIQNSDQIVVIKNGTVIEYGTHQELLRQNGLYAKLTEMQNLK